MLEKGIYEKWCIGGIGWTTGRGEGGVRDGVLLLLYSDLWKHVMESRIWYLIKSKKQHAWGEVVMWKNWLESLKYVKSWGRKVDIFVFVANANASLVWKTGVLRSLKHCDCRWKSKSGSMNNLRYELFALRIFSLSKSSKLVHVMES